MGNRRPLATMLPSIFCLLALSGCGPGRGDLTGNVSLQGKSLRFGTVTVLSDEGIPKSGVIKDGIYSIQGIQTGTLKAMVTSPDPGVSQPAQRIPGTPPPKVDRAGWFPIPEKYGDFGTSGLTFTLKGGANTWDIDLTK